MLNENMIIPNEIKIANHIFTVLIRNDEMKSDNKHGECSFGELTIRISDDFNASHVKETLLHEIMHATWWSYNIHDKDDEERTITTLAAGLCQVFQDNPKVVNLFTETTK